MPTRNERRGAGDEQWVFDCALQGDMGEIDQVFTTFILPAVSTKGTPKNPKLPESENSFWLAAFFHNPGKTWQHFAQVGIDEQWNQNGFVGWKGFYASTLDLAQPGDPTSLRVHNFPTELTYQAREELPVKITRKPPWELRLGSESVELPFPNREIFRDWALIALEDLDKDEEKIWHGVVYTATTPYLRFQPGNIVRAWRHAQIQITHNSPPRYVGVETERFPFRKWFGYPPRKIHFGDIGKPRRWGSLW